jgi:hypothetical protein
MAAHQKNTRNRYCGRAWIAITKGVEEGQKSSSVRRANCGS